MAHIIQRTAVAILGLLCATDCLANIGETVDEVEKRYGSNIETRTQFGIPLRLYDYIGFRFVVFFLHGRSAAEIVGPPYKEKRPYTDQESVALIKEVSGVDGWRQTEVSTLRRQWMSTNGFRAERNDSAVHTKDIYIVTPELLSVLEAANQKKTPDLASKFDVPPPQTETQAVATARLNAQKSDSPTNTAARDGAHAAAAEKKSAADKVTFNFHKERAESGNAGSMYRLGQLYLTGAGCPVDTNQAKVWFQKAADAGNADAATALKSLAN